MRLRSIAAMSVLTVLSAASAPTMANAGEANGATITSINTNQNGILVFYTSVIPSNRPACAVQDGWSINTTTLAGQTVAATVHTAMAAGLKVDVVGLSICREYSTIETVSYLTIRR